MIRIKTHGNDKSTQVAIIVTKSSSIIVTARGRGRPATGKAMTNAQRQAKFKARKRAGA